MPYINVTVSSPFAGTDVVYSFEVSEEVGLDDPIARVVDEEAIYMYVSSSLSLTDEPEGDEQ